MALPESPLPDALNGDAVRSQLYLNMADGQDQLRQRVMFALEPDHRRLGQQGHHRRRAHAVGAAAVAQRLRQLPHAAARGLAEPDDGQVPRQRVQPQGDGDDLAQRELRPRAVAALLDRHLGSEQRRQPETRRRRRIRSRATARRRSPTSPARSPAGPIRRGPVRPPATTTRSTSSATWCRTSSATRHDTDAKTLLNGYVVPAGLTAPPGTRPGRRQHLQSPERAAVHRHAAHPLDGDVEPEPRLRRPRLGGVHQQRRRRARRPGGGGARGAARPRGPQPDDGRARPPEGPGAARDRIRPRPGRDDQRPEQLPERVLEPEPARAHAGDGVQLLPADGADSRADHLLRAGVPAVSAGAGDSARQLHLRHHHRPVRLGLRDRPGALPGRRRRSRGAGRHGEPAADDGPHVEPAAPGAHHRHGGGAGLRSQPARHRRHLPGGHLERVHRLRRRLQRRRRDPDQRAVADRAHRGLHQRQHADAALDAAGDRPGARPAICSKAGVSPGAPIASLAHRQPGGAVHLRRAQSVRSTSGCGR